MRLAAPKAGLSIQQIAGRWAHPVQDAYEGVRAVDDEDIRARAATDFQRNFFAGEGQEPPRPEVLFELAASAAVAITVLALIHDRSIQSFSEGAQWFFGKVEGPLPLSSLGREVEEHLQPLWRLPWDERSIEILPQVFEVFVTGPVGTSRNAVKGRRNDRRKKRESGAFYTPLDVADYIAGVTVTEWMEARTANGGSVLPACVDPACGTGIFLLALLDTFSSRIGPPATLDDAAERVRTTLFGFDLNIQATQAASFVLLGWCLAHAESKSDLSPSQALSRFAANLRTLDATKVRAGGGPRICARDTTQQQYTLSGIGGAEETSTIGDLTNEAAAKFDVVLGNPPYSTVDLRGKRSSAYQPFVEMMWRFAKPDGSAGMVLPLSIAYNQSRRDKHLRERMERVSGHWRFAFFDRTPDSLFGDDVKTRNAVAFLTMEEGSQGQLSTTSFLRWSSRQRSTLFRDLAFQPVGWDLAVRAIPKLGSVDEVRAYRALLEVNSRVGDVRCLPDGGHGLSSGDGRPTLLLSSTAYNWLPVFPLNWLRSEGQDGAIRSGAWKRDFSDSQTAAVVFALLQSRLSYWLWRVEGDGFHLTRWFVDSLPYGPLSADAATRETLAALARQLWTEMVGRPVRSVNGGRVSLSYSPLGSQETISAIDEVLCSAFRLPTKFAAFLSHFVEETIVAGRERDPGASA